MNGEEKGRKGREGGASLPLNPPHKGTSPLDPVKYDIVLDRFANSFDYFFKFSA